MVNPDEREEREVIRGRPTRDALHDRDLRTYASLFLAFAATLFAIMFTVLVFWLAISKQNAKLYESDNVVCVSQPLAVQCFERKPR